MSDGVATKLTFRPGFLDDWWLIERHEETGERREWLEHTGPHSMALRVSARLGNADVEGSASEMLAIADAIEKGDVARFKRCAVDATLTDGVAFWSPRNSTTQGWATHEAARDLAAQIRARLGVP